MKKEESYEIDAETLEGMFATWDRIINEDTYQQRLVDDYLNPKEKTLEDVSDKIINDYIDDYISDTLSYSMAVWIADQLNMPDQWSEVQSRLRDNHYFNLISKLITKENNNE